MTPKIVTVSIPLTIPIILGVWLLVPVASYMDAAVTIEPKTAHLTVVLPSGGSSPGLWDYFWMFMKLNYWECLLFTSGAVVSAVSWNKRIKVSVPDIRFDNGS